MKKKWSRDELIEIFTLLPEEYLLLKNKTTENLLGFAVLFKFFQCECAFPSKRSDIPAMITQYIAKQLDVNPLLIEKYELDDRNTRNHKAQIRDYWGFRKATNEDFESMNEWLNMYINANRLNPEFLKSCILWWFKERAIESPSMERIDRSIKTGISRFESGFFKLIANSLSESTKVIMDQTVDSSASLDDENTSTFNKLKSDPGRISLETVFLEIKKLESVNTMELPDTLLKKYSAKFINTYKARVASEDIREIRRHSPEIKYGLLTCFFYARKREVADNLVDLLIQITHRIKVRAERKIDKQLIKDFRKVSGKNNLLFNIAENALAAPNGTVKDVIYPIANEQTLRALVKEFKSSGVSYQRKVHTVMRNSYGRHYGRMLPDLLAVLNFKSNNEVYRPIIDALELIKKYIATNIHYYPVHEHIPIEGVIRNKWRPLTIEHDEYNDSRVNRINYEIFVLQTLRDKLRCKEIWVEGSDRYRNPEEDLPVDFEEKRKENYEALKKPLDADLFIESLKTKMTKSLDLLNQNIPKNPKVRITTRNNGWICLSPLEQQPEPENINQIKKSVADKWPMTNLLDILKEADLRMSFTDAFKTVGTHERLEKSDIQKRLILSLFGLGTNTGLKRVSSGNNDVSYKDLLYIRRKFINKDNLRLAISQVVNSILNVRMEDIWGEGITSCASDSKKFGSWDQNLMAEWHIRYRGRGVMIYWHVEKNSTCIYSQLKSCSSSEVAAMIEGLLKHCTDMEIEKNYVDTHGQSEVAFAFCHLLGFNLMPRIKSIGRQKLYRPDKNMANEYANLTPILTRPINWEFTALRLGTADTESILKRFTRNNLRHPTYLAFAELGKAVKTIFLCEYLMSEKMRSEIQKGLNVVENWNSANSFIFYGKGGEIATNRIEDQEISVLALHLLQNCMVFINTLMVQQVIKEQQWVKQMSTEDLRALTPLFYTHINPYGSFDLNMNERIEVQGF
jgi:TnpA family transposase